MVKEHTLGIEILAQGCDHSRRETWLQITGGRGLSDISMVPSFAWHPLRLQNCYDKLVERLTIHDSFPGREWNGYPRTAKIQISYGCVPKSQRSQEDSLEKHSFREHVFVVQFLQVLSCTSPRTRVSSGREGGTPLLGRGRSQRPLCVLEYVGQWKWSK
ncbi:hypothetical protein OG21DRAFT_1514977 [Imleria badia]|nr:hypothetical protein OG21DRAFT_1514977 [Imleria badia]